MTKCLVMCLTEPSGDPRPNRAINLLQKEGYIVDVLSYPINDFDNLSFNKNITIEYKTYKKNIFNSIYIRVIKYLAYVSGYLPMGVLFIDKYNEYIYGTHSVSRHLSNHSYDVLIVEDVFLLSLAVKYKSNAKIIFDAREYYPKRLEHDPDWKLFEQPMLIKLCKKYLKLCDAHFTVSLGLADMYKKEYGIDMEVLYSTPEFRSIEIRDTKESNIKMVYHGIANKNRNLINLIKVFKLLDRRFTLDLYLTGDDYEHIQEIKEFAKGCSRVKILKPVNYEEIIPMLSEYDVGFFYVEPITFNLLNCLPNKFFEFIQARLAVAIGPSPDMASLVNEYKNGFIAPEFTLTSMANTLNNLTINQINVAKHNSNKAAKILNYENEGKKLINRINKLL